MSSLIPAPLIPINQAAESSRGAKTKVPREWADVSCLPPSAPTKKLRRHLVKRHINQSIPPALTVGRPSPAPYQALADVGAELTNGRRYEQQQQRKQGSWPWPAGGRVHSPSAVPTHQCHGHDQILRGADPQPASISFQGQLGTRLQRWGAKVGRRAWL